MAVLPCQYCGAEMNMPLKFCRSCGRPISASDKKRFGGMKSLSKAANTKRLDDAPSASSFGLTRKSYGVQRSMREFLFNFSWALVVLMIVIVALKYVFETVLPKMVPAKQPTPVQVVPNTVPNSKQP